jgi:hypothetical protein
VAANGRLGGYGGSEATKRALLIAEGVVVSGTRIRDFQSVRIGRASTRRPAGPARRMPAHAKPGTTRRRTR